MKKKTTLIKSLAVFLALLLGASQGVIAQNEGGDKTFKQEELDQLLAPIALYPDSLLAQILMASTYPLEVVQAGRWIKANQALKGDALSAALEKENWDPSVKSLVNFPRLRSTSLTMRPATLAPTLRNCCNTWRMKRLRVHWGRQTMTTQSAIPDNADASLNTPSGAESMMMRS